MDDVISLKFGIFNDFTVPFNVGSINSVFTINHRECICTTTRNLYKIEKNEIKMTAHQITFSVSLLIPDSDIIVGITTRTNRLFVCQLTNLSQPIISNYPINHLGVYHIYYSPKSSSLILVGYGIKVYYLHLKYNGNRHSIFPPDVKIKFRSKFCEDYNPIILNPAPFDTEHEYIYIPTKEGICPYDLDGNKKDLASRFPASMATVYFYNPFSRKIITFDCNHGLIKWTQGGQIEQRFPSAGTSIVSMLLVDEENIICYNSMKQIFLLNFITGRTFFCYNLDKKPTRLFLVHLFNKPYLIVCEGATLIGLKIEIPWNVWCHPLLNCSNIIRCNQMNEAGRIFVQTKGNIIDLYSPSKGQLINSATQKKAVTPISFYYDRGLIQYSKKNYSKYELFQIKIEPLENSRGNDRYNGSAPCYCTNDKLRESHRDILYFLFDDGSISGFYTGVSPCEEIINLNLRANFLCVAFYEDKWCYAAVSRSGILSLYDYVSFDLIMQTNVGYLDVINFFYDAIHQSLIIVNKKSTLIYDLKTKQTKSEIGIAGSDVVTFFGNFLKFGYKSGHIITVFIENGTFNAHSIIDSRSHETEITEISFSQEFWISSSLDSRLIAWNYNEEKMFQVVLPLPLTACCVINGYRDILVSTDSEIMKIEGKRLFLAADDEIAEIDNYDRLCDYLEHPHHFLIDQMKGKVKSKLSSYKTKSSTNESKSDNRSILSNKTDKSDIKPDNRSSKHAHSKSERRKSKSGDGDSKSGSDNNNNNSVSSPKTRTVLDNERIIQSMMELNGLKSPIVPKLKPNLVANNQQAKITLNINLDNDKEEEKSATDDESEDEPAKKPPKKPISGKDFLKSEMAKEKRKSSSSSKPKRAKRKKNDASKGSNQKAEPNESTMRPKKSAIDLLNQMNQGRQKEKQPKASIPKKGSTIDFASLAKQFEKVSNEDEAKKLKQNEYEYEDEDESDTESDSEKRPKKKSKSSKKKKEKSAKNENSIAAQKSDASIKNKVDIKISKSPSNKSKTNLIKKSKQSPAKKEKVNKIAASKSQENSLLQSRGVQLNEAKKDEDEEVAPNIENKEEETQAEKEDNNQITIANEEEVENELFERSNDNDDQYLHNSLNESSEEEFDTTANPKDGENHQTDQNSENPENSDFQDKGELNSPNECQNHVISPCHREPDKDEIMQNSPSQKKFNNSLNFKGHQNVNSYRPPGKFSFKLKHFEDVKDCRVRSSTPDPSYKSVVKRSDKTVTKLHRSFSCHPKKKKDEFFYEYNFDNIDEIPPNIWIDDNALYERYSIQRNHNEKADTPFKKGGGVIVYDKKNSIQKNSVKLPEKPISNFFRRKTASTRSNDATDDKEKEIDETVNRLELNQFQLHQFQRNFEYNLTYRIYNESESNKNQPNNKSVNRNFERKENFDSKIQYFTKNQKNKNLNEKLEGATVKVYKLKQKQNTHVSDDNIRLKNRDEKDEIISSNIQKDNIDFNNGNEHVIEPPSKKQPKSPRKVKKADSKRLNNFLSKDNFYFTQDSNNNDEVDELEQAFLKKMPKFEMKNKRPNSSRRISKPHPKLYLNPVYPPNRNRGIDGTIVRSSLTHNNNFNYY